MTTVFYGVNVSGVVSIEMRPRLTITSSRLGLYVRRVARQTWGFFFVRGIHRADL